MPSRHKLTRLNFKVIHPRCVFNYNRDSRFSRTQQFVYSILTLQHVPALRAIIRLAKMEDKYTILNRLEISVSYIYIALYGYNGIEMSDYVL